MEKIENLGKLDGKELEKHGLPTEISLKDLRICLKVTPVGPAVGSERLAVYNRRKNQLIYLGGGGFVSVVEMPDCYEDTASGYITGIAVGDEDKKNGEKTRLYEVGPYELRRYFVLDDPQKQKELETICSRALSPIRNKKLKQEAFKDSEKPFVDQVWAMLLGTSGYDLNKAGKKLRKDALKAMREFKMPRSDIFEIAEGMREVGVKWEKVAERDDSVFLTDKNVKDIILARKTYVTRGKKQDAANEISI